MRTASVPNIGTVHMQHCHVGQLIKKEAVSKGKPSIGRAIPTLRTYMLQDKQRQNCITAGTEVLHYDQLVKTTILIERVRVELY